MDHSDNTEIMEYRDDSTEESKMNRNDAEADKSLFHACNICGKSFPFQSSLSQHMRKHTGDKPYKCPYCDHRASQKGNLKIHIRSHKMGTLSHGHKEEEEDLGGGQLEPGVSDVLDNCNSSTKSMSACNKIMNRAAKEENSKILLRSIKKGKTGGSDGGKSPTFQCSICKRKLNNKEDLEQHIQVLHKPYRCRLCSFVALREDQLLSHIEKVHITVEAPIRDVVDVEAVKSEQDTGEGDFSCEVCGQVFTQAWFLKAHMKKHGGTFDHGCHICGRRFREPWFLKNHMKSHGTKTGGKSKPKSDSEPLATINDVVQEETAVMNGLCLYELCPKCGNIFHNRESLRQHDKVHTQASKNCIENETAIDCTAEKNNFFIECLNLRPAGTLENITGRKLGKRIAELDPVSSYQAWQLATKGKVAEVSEYAKYIGWDETLAEADVAYDREKEEYILVGQEKRKREPDSHTAGSGKRRNSSNVISNSSSRSSYQQRAEKYNNLSPGDLSPERHSDSDYRPSSRQSRRSSQNKNTECFECGKVFRTYHQMVLHSRVHRRETRNSSESNRVSRENRCGLTSEGESGSASRPSTPGSASVAEDSPTSAMVENVAEDSSEEGLPLTPDEKPNRCRNCDYATTSSSLLMSHMKDHHMGDQDVAFKSRDANHRNDTSLAESQTHSGDSLPRNNVNGNIVKSGEYPSYLELQTAVMQQNLKFTDSFKCLENTISPSMEQAVSNSIVNLRTSAETQTKGMLSDSEKERVLQENNAWDKLAIDTIPLDLTSKSNKSDFVLKDLPTSPIENTLIKHQCPYCSHTTHYPEVLWMHEIIAHKVSCNAAAPKWVQRNVFKGPKKDLGFSSRRSSTGPPLVLDGKDCQPLPVTRSARTQAPPRSSLQAPKSNATTYSSNLPGTSQARDTAAREAPTDSGLHNTKQPKLNYHKGQHGVLTEQSHGRPKLEMNPKVAPAGTIENNFMASHRPLATFGDRQEKCLFPLEGLGFSVKHGLSEHKVKAYFSQPPSYHSPMKSRQETPPAHAQRESINDPRSVGRNSMGGRVNSSSHNSGSTGWPPSLQVHLKQEPLPEGPETHLDILSFLKTCNTQDLTTLYHCWGSNNPMLDQTGMLRSQIRQGDYVCKECGKSFSQTSHLRTHVRSHTVVFESNGLRGTEVHTTSADAPKQGRDHSSVDIALTVPLRRGT
ncbi:zinc finger protein 516-like isoform X2 [Polyodon spathula]|uniref:zinc finger protein 516-like isoform X2 n=1 Tax=Polyodon spathula TaxID=7913 RepID=UPI001B7EA61C|nr:zinc finger protein 516-like isoform X2 [Polyodon spathula]